MKKGVKKKDEIDEDEEEDKVDETSYRPYRMQQKTFGQKAADSLSSWVGSWHYLIFLTIFLLLWIIVNTSFFMIKGGWDPFPFILLNLVLAAIAAIEVPIILMSQNRQSLRAMAREEYDYAVNRKAEKEIRGIREQLNRIEEKLEE